MKRKIVDEEEIEEEVKNVSKENVVEVEVENVVDTKWKETKEVEETKMKKDLDRDMIETTDIGEKDSIVMEEEEEEEENFLPEDILQEGFPREGFLRGTGTDTDNTIDVRPEGTHHFLETPIKIK